MRNQYNLLFVRCLVIGLGLLLAREGQAQSGSFGNTFISTGNEMSILNVQHNFLNGGSGVLPGIVGTERTSPAGYLSFVGTASHTGASDAAHVDGYAKTYMTTPFTFPIGDNGSYRPAAVSAASLSSPANAAYFGVSAGSAITNSIKGGNEPVLPSGGPFSLTAKASDVATVSNVEYWDINGATSARITLTWNTNSAVSTLTTNNLSQLTILGWNGTQWVKIPSTVDGTALLGGTSSLTAGSITTDAALTPDTYTVYTLGGKAATQGSGTVDCAKTQIVPAPVSGTASQTTLMVTVNVTTAGTFPLTISGSGMSLANGITSITTTRTGVQTFHIPVEYDGSALGILTFTIGTAGSCTADLRQSSRQVVCDIWTLNNCTTVIPGVLSK